MNTWGKNYYMGLLSYFFYARGVNTYWHSLLDKDMELLKKSPYILEMDLASCFKNINRTKLLSVLKEDYGLPNKVIGIINHFISLKVPVSGLKYPSSASYAESLHNTTPGAPPPPPLPLLQETL